MSEPKPIDGCRPCPVIDRKVTTVATPSPPTPGAVTANPPAIRDSSCSVDNINITTTPANAPNGSNTATENITYVPGPQGPDGWGFKWENKWAADNEYWAQSEAHPLASTVEYNNSTYVCIKDHTSSLANQPVGSNSTFDWKGDWATGEVYTTYDASHKYSAVNYSGTKYICISAHISEAGMEPDTDTTHWSEAGEGTVGEGVDTWELMAKEATNMTSTLNPTDKSILDTLKQYSEDIWDWVENADLEDWLLAGAIAAGVIVAGAALVDALTPDPDQVDEDQNATYNGSLGYSGSATAPNLRDVVASLCDYVGISYNVSLLPTSPCEFTVASNTQVRSVLEQLSLAYQFDMIDSEGTLKFVPRNITVVDTLTLDDLGYSSSNDAPTPYTAKRYQGITLPKSVSLTYISPDIDYNNFTQRSDLFSFDEGQDINLSVPLVLAHDKAKEICETTIINAHLERTNYKFTTTYKFLHLEPGDVVDSPMGLVRIVKVDETEEGILEFEATDAGESGSLTGTGLNVQLPTPSNNVPKVVTMSGGLFVDPNNIDDSDKGVRIFCAVHGFGKETWGGAAIYMSSDNGATFQQIANTTVPSTVGLVEYSVPYKPHQTWDLTTQITVKMTSGTLTSKDEIAVLNGANRCLIGNEMIAFCNAQLISENTYRLTKLLRGRQGTEAFCATHQDNELFCLVDGLVRLDFDDSLRGSIRQFKVVSIGADLSSVDAISVQIMSNNTKLWSVYNTSAYLEGAGWHVFWKERVRFDNQLKDFAGTNHDSDWGGYGIAVINPLDDSDIVRTITTTSEDWVYTNQMQVQDFGQLIPHAKFSIVPMSTKWGGGYPTVINT